MQEIQPAASYVRNPQALEGRGEDEVLADLAEPVQPADAGQRIWELLETPQTIETICRVLNNEFDLSPGESAQSVKVVMTHLYRRDLIQLSPDS